MALLVVLVVVTLLTSVLMDLAFSTFVDLRLTETFRDSTRAYYLAKGGINAGRMLLQDDKNSYDALNEPWSQGVYNYPVGEGAVSIEIEDQDGKLSINALVFENSPQAVMVDRFYRLFTALDLGYQHDPAELTAALIDWLDTGDEPYREILTDGANRPVSGAENAYYVGLSPSYPCKNGPLETIDELSLVKGFSPELLKRLLPHLSTAKTLTVNINTASAEVLMSLDIELDREAVDEIINYRSSKPIKNISELEDILSAQAYAAIKTQANLDQLGTVSTIYRISSRAIYNDGQRRLLADVDKKGNKLLFLKVD